MWWWDNNWHGLNCLLICSCLWVNSETAVIGFASVRRTDWILSFTIFPSSNELELLHASMFSSVKTYFWNVFLIKHMVLKAFTCCSLNHRLSLCPLKKLKFIQLTLASLSGSSRIDGIHWFLIRFKSGLHADLSITLALLCWRWFFTRPDVASGCCWKRKPQPRSRFTADALGFLSWHILHVSFHPEKFSSYTPAELYSYCCVNGVLWVL